jgi:hypothetical protein
MPKRLAFTVALVLALALPASAAALPYLSIGNARHVLEVRFEEEEEEGLGTDELANCYRVSATHVNCYSDYSEEAESCSVWLWRVWEATTRPGYYTVYTKGHPWRSYC